MTSFATSPACRPSTCYTDGQHSPTNVQHAENGVKSLPAQYYVESPFSNLMVREDTENMAELLEISSRSLAFHMCRHQIQVMSVSSKTLSSIDPQFVLVRLSTKNTDTVLLINCSTSWGSR